MSSLFKSLAAGPFGLRQKRVRGARIPVFVMTGFLGAGKTTLLKRFLSTPEGRGTAVVVNEFGDAGIDDALLRDSAETTTLLGNGCICCNVRSDLENTLQRLAADRARGAVPFFQRIVIETSGLADPSPILASFASERSLAGAFHLESVITVVPAVSGDETLATFAEARRQAMVADLVVISKADLTDAAAVDALAARIAALNAGAPVVAARQGDVDPALLLAGDAAGRSNPARRSGFHAEAAQAEHTDGIRSFTLRDAAPMPWEVFARTMELLMALRGSDLLRVKGLVNVEGCRGPVVVQFVQHLGHPPVELAAWPDDDHASRVVFVVRDLDERDVTSLFTAVRNTARRSRR
jgi:G3E family GTPase